MCVLSVYLAAYVGWLPVWMGIFLRVGGRAGVWCVCVMGVMGGWGSTEYW